MRAVLVALVIMSATAAATPARPSTDPRWLRAEALWKAADAEGDQAKQSAAWAAADAFLEVAAVTSLDKALRIEAAVASMEARKQAISTERITARVRDSDDRYADRYEDRLRVPVARPIGDVDKKLIASAGMLLSLVPGERSDRVVFARFMRARIRVRYDDLAGAIPDFIAILDEDRNHEVALYSANLLLDSFNRLERYDELVVWAKKLRADVAFMKRNPELEEVVIQIEAVSIRKEAERHEAAGKKGGDRREYLACAASYDRVLALVPHVYNAEEFHYNAGVCLEEGADRDGALARYRRIVAEYPRTKLAARALLRSARIHTDARHLRDAALAYEDYMRRWPGERDVKDVRREARWLRLELFATSTMRVSLRRVSILVAP